MLLRFYQTLFSDLFIYVFRVNLHTIYNPITHQRQLHRILGMCFQRLSASVFVLFSDFSRIISYFFSEIIYGKNKACNEEKFVIYNINLSAVLKYIIIFQLYFNYIFHL